jgi:hypothetical protein
MRCRQGPAFGRETAPIGLSDVRIESASDKVQLRLLRLFPVVMKEALYAFQDTSDMPECTVGQPKQRMKMLVSRNRQALTGEPST